METALDIYTKLLLAFISFTAPVIVFLLSVFSDGIGIIKKNIAEKEKQFGKLITGMGQSSLNEVEENVKKLRKEEKANKRTLNLLNPKRQIIRIFLMLTASLLFLVAYGIIKDHSLGLYNHTVAVLLLLSSLATLSIALIFLKCVAWEAIDTKHRIAAEKPKSVGTASSPEVKTQTVTAG